MTKNYRIQLNRKARENYCFFCSESPLHLNICQPVGTTTRLTSSILRGIKGGTLIDLDNIMSTIDDKEKQVVEDVIKQEEVVEVIDEVVKPKPKRRARSKSE